MRILNSCVVWQDSILQTGVCVRQSIGGSRIFLGGAQERVHPDM